MSFTNMNCASVPFLKIWIDIILFNCRYLKMIIRADDMNGLELDNMQGN